MKKRIEAHNNIKPKKQTIRQRVLEVCNGKSLFEIASELNVKPQTISGRLSELEKDGIIYKATANVLIKFIKNNENLRKLMTLA